MYTEPKQNLIEKISFAALILVFIAFIISVPFMASDKEKRQQEAWQEKGCQMYDDQKIEEVPAKCHSEFIDKYKSQELRAQPND